jgi:formylglycine-generating enzyme required for sulfatase activity
MPRLLKFLALVTVIIGGTVLAIASRPVAEADTPAPKGDHKNYTETISGKDDEKASFEMVAISGGTFIMGSPESEKSRNADEGPQHPVSIRPFWLGKCEVTWDEFDLFQNEVGVEAPEDNEERLKTNADALTGPTPPYVEKHYGHPHAGHPALCMTHHCAMEYCRWLSKKTGKQYRLPTEAEWEYSARAGSKSAWFFGDDPAQFGDYAWYKKNSPTEKKLNGGTHKVGSKKPNAFGLYDMYGNVMEWCLDHYYKDAYAKFPLDKPSLSPVFLPTERKWPHVARGGSWADNPEACRSASRRASELSWMRDDPNRPRSIWWLTKFDVIGFRVARAVEEQENLKNLRSKVTRESPDE